MTAEVPISAPIAEFPEALQFLFDHHRYKVAYGGRGGTKSWGFARALLIQGAERSMRILCARETMKSIADSVHRLLGDQIDSMGMRSFYEVQQTTIRGINGTEFVFAGLRHNIDNIKSLEGCDVVWVEEAANVSKESWDKLIPTMRKEGSEIWISYNPELDTDETHRRFVVNRAPPGAMVVKVSWQDNPWFPDVLRIEAEHLRATDPTSYAHIYGGECRSAVEGAVYGEEMKAAYADGRICSVPLDRTAPVDTFWDLGFGDKTAIWFAQALTSGWYNVIDYLENDGKTIDWYLIQLQNRGYLYGNDWVPHDAVDTIVHHRLGQDKSRSIEMLMRAAGRNVRLTPKLHVTDGINAVRTIMPQCRFDSEKCADGLQALRRYQWGPVSANGVSRREPLHNEASHGADAFRGLALSIKQPRAPVAKREQPVHVGGAWS